MVIIVCLSTVVYAPSPFQQSTVLSKGCEIKHPIFDAVQQNTGHQFNFHVINSSDGLPLNTSMNCFFHLYNSTGHHIFENGSLSLQEENDYYVDVNSSYFGGDTLNYIIQCYKTNVLGCFVSSEIKVTPTGGIYSADYTILAVIMVLLFLSCGTIGFIIFTSKKWLKLFLAMPLYLFLMSIFRILSMDLSVKMPTESGLISIINMFYTFLVATVYPFMGICMFATVILCIKSIREMMRERKQKKMNSDPFEGAL